MNEFRVPLIAALTGLLLLFGTGYAYLDRKKADKDTIAVIQQDVREIRTFLMGPKP